MTMMTAAAFEKGQAVNVFTEGEWCKGMVTGIDAESERPYLVMYNVNGVGDESWFDPASVRPH